MIRNFCRKGLERFFRTGSASGIQAGHAGKLRVQLTALDHAGGPNDVNAPGWRLHRLHGDRDGQYAIMVNGNWRLVFHFEDGDVLDVDYVDYH